MPARAKASGLSCDEGLALARWRWISNAANRVDGFVERQVVDVNVAEAGGVDRVRGLAGDYVDGLPRKCAQLRFDGVLRLLLHGLDEHAPKHPLATGGGEQALLASGGEREQCFDEREGLLERGSGRAACADEVSGGWERLDEADIGSLESCKPCWRGIPVKDEDKKAVRFLGDIPWWGRRATGRFRERVVGEAV